MLIASFPHNPTTATVDLPYLTRAGRLLPAARPGAGARPGLRRDLLRRLQAAERPAGARARSTCAIEFTLALEVARDGGLARRLRAPGNPELVRVLARVKSYLDYGTFQPIQIATIVALDGPQDFVAEIVEDYRERRNALVDGLEQAGWKIEKPLGTMFVWAPLPERFASLGSLEFSKLLLEKAQVAVAPGVGFGPAGEGFVRFALVENTHRIRQAVRNIEAAAARWLSGPCAWGWWASARSAPAWCARSRRTAPLDRPSGSASRSSSRASPTSTSSATAAFRSAATGCRATGASSSTIPTIDLVVELVGGTRVARERGAGRARRGQARRHREQGAARAARARDLRAGRARRAPRSPSRPAWAGPSRCCARCARACARIAIQALHGIVNGTCNYILTEMEANGEPYEACLKRAQDLGYAEADPSFDVDGIDSAHKLAILVGLAFGVHVAPDAFPIEGIRRIVPADIEYARRIGFRIKLLAVAQARRARDRGARAPDDDPAAERARGRGGLDERDRGARRALGSDALLRRGRGLAADRERGGRGPDGARARAPARRVGPRAAARHARAARRRAVRAGRAGGEFYVRFTALDSPGVLSRITGALGARGISIASVLQEERHAIRAVPIVITTHESRQADLDAALAEIATLREVVAPRADRSASRGSSEPCRPSARRSTTPGSSARAAAKAAGRSPR